MLALSRSRLVARLLTIGSGCVLLLAACGDDNGKIDAASAGAGGGSGIGAPPSAGETASSPAAEFLKAYADSVCAMYEPCCTSEGLGFDRAGCTEWFSEVTDAYFGERYRDAQGRACLDALDEARAVDPARCSNVPAFDEATLREQCSSALTAPEREGEPLGGKCLLAGDCASAASDGSVICYSGTCLLQRRGAAGDGPCYLSGRVLDGLPTEAFQCDARDGLYCHRGDNACAPVAGDGEPCPYPGACGEAALCVGGVCRRLPEIGEACLNGVSGAGGFCRAGSVCDRASLTCAPGGDVGDPCTDAKACATGVCLDGACAKSDFTKSLNCTG